MADVLRIVGTIAGIGGISLGIILLIYKDFIREFIQAKVFKTLTSSQATVLLGSVVIFTFLIAILGIFVGFVKDTSPTYFLVLVLILLAFSVVVFYMIMRPSDLERGQQIEEKKTIYQQVHGLLENSMIDDAERELSKAVGSQRNSADFWYWKSRIAFSRQNQRVALSYLDEAIRRDSHHANSINLKIKLLLLSGVKNDRVKAKELALKSRGITDSLDVWLNCLQVENIFSTSPTSNREIELKCPSPNLDDTK